jgi:hypothetical protein
VFHRDIYEISGGRISSEVFQIATARIDGVGGINMIRQVSRGSGHNVGSARWSPGLVGGAERIVWIEDGSAIVVARTDGTEARRVATAEGSERFGAFEWFSDGTRLIGDVFDRETGANFLRLYDVSCSSTCTATLATDLTDLAPIGPEDGLGAIVARNHDWIVAPICPGGRGPCDLWKIEIDVTGPEAPIVTRVTQLTLTEFDEQEVSWSPDDTQVLFTAWPVDNTRKAIILDLTLVELQPWDGNLAQVSVIADVGNSGGMDWRRTP